MRHTTAGEIDSWLSSLAKLVETQTCPAPEFFRPFHFITLALCLKSNRALHVELPMAVKDYATRMHLWQAIGLRPPANVTEHDASGRFLPIEPLRSRQHVEDCAKKIAEIATHARMNDEARESLATALSELIDNCFAHAGSNGDLHGLACAQYWPRGKLLQIAIADMGMGIRASFADADSEEMRRKASEMNCCELATQLHASSKINSGHAGYGLALARQLAEQNGGTLAVYSGDEWFHSSQGHGAIGAAGVPWSGTLVVVEFNTERLLSTQRVYQSWPPVRGYSDDDFDF